MQFIDLLSSAGLKRMQSERGDEASVPPTRGINKINGSLICISGHQSREVGAGGGLGRVGGTLNIQLGEEFTNLVINLKQIPSIHLPPTQSVSQSVSLVILRRTTVWYSMGLYRRLSTGIQVSG